jgi:hypothetical protein
MTTPEGGVPYDWERVGGGDTATVQYDGNQVYPDTYSYSVSDPTTVDGITLTKKFDDEKARPFVNGVLNSVKNKLEADGKIK